MSEGKYSDCASKWQNVLLPLATLGMGIIIAVGIGLAIGLRPPTPLNHIRPSSCQWINNQSNTVELEGHKGETSDNGFKSAFGKYTMAAVQSDNEVCSKIGMNVMVRYGGSATDAAIATMFCTGTTIFHSAGIGGGHFMTVFDREKDAFNKTIRTLLAREVLPGAGFKDYFKNHSSFYGGTSVGVPGTLHGLYTAWKMYGRVPWSQLVMPSIKLAEGGFRVHKSVAIAIEKRAERILKANNTNLRLVITKPNGALYKEGDIIKRPKLARTLKVIASDPMSFYNGSLANDIVADVEEAGGMITKEDLSKYQTRVRDPIIGKLKSLGLTMYSPEPPSSGVVLQYILRLLDGFGFDNSSLHDTESAAQTYHKIMESFKFAFGRRSALGDAKFWNISEIIRNMTNDDFIDQTRRKIDTTQTRDLDYYDHLYDLADDAGTSHISVLAPDGGGVGMTATINYLFGSHVYGSRTGILFNNEMDDFSVPGKVNYFNISASPSNFPEPGKMPMSSMSPTIFLTENDDVAYISGAAGGPRIISAMAYVALHHFYFKMNLQSATDIPRLHHQLLPNVIKFERGFDEGILKELQRLKHEIAEVEANGVVGSLLDLCSTCKTSNDCVETCLHAVADGRKGGAPYGY